MRFPDFKSWVRYHWSNAYPTDILFFIVGVAVTLAIVMLVFMAIVLAVTEMLSHWSSALVGGVLLLTLGMFVVTTKEEVDEKDR